MTDKLRFAPLVRVSTETQERMGESLRTQKAQIEQTVKALNGTLIPDPWKYSGQEHSTPTFERQRFDQLLKDAGKGLFDAVIVVDTSRWSRDNLKSKQGLQVLKEHGVRFFAGGVEHDLFDPQAEFFLGMATEFNEYSAKIQTKKSLQSTPDIPAEARSYLATVNQINGVSEGEGEIGGPIWRDKVWFWGAYGKQDIDILTPTLFAGQRFRDRTTLKNENVKVNAQPLSSNSLTLVDQYGSKIKLGRNVGTNRPPETAWNQNDAYAHGVGSLTDPTLWKIEDTQIIGKNLYITGLYSKVQGGFQLIADNGKGCQSLACGVATDPFWYNEEAGSYERSYLSEYIIRPQTQYRADGSAFFDTGSINHELKFGFGYRKATVNTQIAYPGGQWTDNYAIAGITINAKNPADTGEAHFYREPNVTSFGTQNSFYVGDTMMVGNLTIQPGLRYDVQKTGIGAGIAASNPTVPDILQTLNFPAVGGPKFNNLSPRLGLTYVLGADRKTLLRANLNRYVDQIGGNSTNYTSVSPGAASEASYYFQDLNGDNVAQFNEIDFASGIIGATPSNSVATPRTRLDPNIKSPYTDELLLGAEREVLRDFSVGVDLTYRKLNDFIGYRYEKTQGAGDWYTAADYHLAPPITATLPNGKTTTVQYYVLNAGLKPLNFRMLTNTPDYYQNYKGVDLTLTKRMSNRWMMRGNLTLQDWTQHVGPNAIQDPTRNQACGVCDGSQVIVQSGGSGNKGGVWINSKWQYNLTGVYMIPVIETSFGVNLNGRQGYSIPYVVSARTSTGEGTKTVLAVDQVDTFRNQNVTDLDMRLAKDFRFYRGMGLTLSIDAFNVLNSNTILQRNTAAICSAPQATGVCAPASTANHVTEVLSPRVLRLGANLSF